MSQAYGGQQASADSRRGGGQSSERAFRWVAMTAGEKKDVFLQLVPLDRVPTRSGLNRNAERATRTIPLTRPHVVCLHFATVRAFGGLLGPSHVRTGGPSASPPRDPGTRGHREGAAWVGRGA